MSFDRWDMFSLFGLLGGLSLFLFGMRFASRGLQKAVGGKLRSILGSLTRNRTVGLIVGVTATLMTQSSSATTVMLVGFANTGLLAARQSLGVILGADIGTTLTVQLIAFRIFDFAFLIIALGFFAMIICKGRSGRSVGQIAMGFGLVFLGMKVMSDSAAPLKDSSLVGMIFQRVGDNPIWGVIFSTLFTAIIQSSGATIGLVLSLSFQGLLDLRSAIPLILGANIGTCATALLASYDTNVEGKRVAWAHTIFKVVGVVLVLPFIGQFSALVQRTASDLPRQIANAHSIFNVAMAVLFLPTVPLFSMTVERLVAGRREIALEYKPKYLDSRVLNTPSLALGHAAKEIMRMADLAYEMLDQAMEVLKKNDELMRQRVIDEDDELDFLDESITSYLTQISQEELTDEESSGEIALLFVAKEIEHIGDVVSKDLMTYAGKKIEEDLYFSEEGFSEIKKLHRKVLDNLQVAKDAFERFDLKLARQAQAGEEEIELLEEMMHNSHIDRLHRGLKESIETSTVHLDLINDLRRIGGHTGNIASVVIGHNNNRMERRETKDEK